MKLNPLAALRTNAKQKANDHFNLMARSNSHLDVAHAQKREWAKTEDERLSVEADLRGITTKELAKLILSKPDTVAVREEKRQRILAQIEKAKTPVELESIFVDI